MCYSTLCTHTHAQYLLSPWLLFTILLLLWRHAALIVVPSFVSHCDIPVVPQSAFIELVGVYPEFLASQSWPVFLSCSFVTATFPRASMIPPGWSPTKVPVVSVLRCCPCDRQLRRGRQKESWTNDSKRKNTNDTLSLSMLRIHLGSATAQPLTRFPVSGRIAVQSKGVAGCASHVQAPATAAEPSSFRKVPHPAGSFRSQNSGHCCFFRRIAPSFAFCFLLPRVFKLRYFHNSQLFSAPRPQLLLTAAVGGPFFSLLSAS